MLQPLVLFGTRIPTHFFSFFFSSLYSIALLTVQLVLTSSEEKAWEFAERVTSGYLTVTYMYTSSG